MTNSSKSPNSNVKKNHIRKSEKKLKAKTIYSTHFDCEQDHLINCYNKTRKILGNTNHMGWGFENEIRNSINRNLTSNVHVGTGEIIHHNLELNIDSNQIDVIIQNAKYPRLPVAGEIESFLIESVVSFGEIKSKLKKEDIVKFSKTVSKIQSFPNLLNYLQKDSNLFNIQNEKQKIRPFTFIIAADTYAHDINIVCDWIQEISSDEKLFDIDGMKNIDDRRYYNHRFIDGIFVLNHGAVVSDSYPFRASVKKQGAHTDKIWMVTKNNPLAWFYTIINQVSYHYSFTEFPLTKYLGGVSRKFV